MANHRIQDPSRQRNVVQATGARPVPGAVIGSGSAPYPPEAADHPAGGRVTAPPDERQIPKSNRARTFMILGLLAVLAATALMAWGFVAPAVDPDEPPVAADGELPVQ